MAAKQSIPQVIGQLAGHDASDAVGDQPTAFHQKPPQVFAAEKSQVAFVQNARRLVIKIATQDFSDDRSVPDMRDAEN